MHGICICMCVDLVTSEYCRVFIKIAFLNFMSELEKETIAEVISVRCIPFRLVRFFVLVGSYYLGAGPSK
jgi:hypothetical protein